MGIAQKAMTRQHGWLEEVILPSIHLSPVEVAKAVI
jgi:hypothetical protein